MRTRLAVVSVLVLALLGGLAYAQATGRATINVVKKAPVNQKVYWAGSKKLKFCIEINGCKVEVETDEEPQSRSDIAQDIKKAIDDKGIAGVTTRIKNATVVVSGVNPGTTPGSVDDPEVYRNTNDRTVRSSQPAVHVVAQ